MTNHDAATPVASPRERILAAAYELFGRRGIRAVGTDDVVRLMVGARIGLPVEVSYVRRGKLEKAAVTPVERERR